MTKRADGSEMGEGITPEQDAEHNRQFREFLHWEAKKRDTIALIRRRQMEYRRRGEIASHVVLPAVSTAQSGLARPETGLRREETT